MTYISDLASLFCTYFPKYLGLNLFNFAIIIGCSLILLKFSRGLITVCLTICGLIFPSKVKNYCKNDEYVVITGASDGIGKEYAINFARNNCNLILVARNKEKLQSVRQEILKLMEHKFQIDVRIVILDFSDPTVKIYTDFEKELISKSGSLYDIRDKISILVNNVGIGYKEPYRLAEIPESYYYGMIDGLLNVNVRSQIHMTRILLKHCLLPRNDKMHKKSLIIDISSLSSRLLQPKGAVYGAVKSMNEYFSECMKLELSHCKDIDIQTITPSWIGTKLGVFKPNPPITPTVKQFVSSAFSTIGWMDSTYGFWGFTLQGWIFEMWPAWVGGRISEVAYWAAVKMNKERFGNFGKTE